MSPPVVKELDIKFLLLRQVACFYWCNLLFLPALRTVGPLPLKMIHTFLGGCWIQKLSSVGKAPGLLLGAVGGKLQLIRV